ncbi:MAG TPA: PBP1A family penicillin-binding protein [Chthoniobacteraceae bacterium]
MKRPFRIFLRIAGWGAFIFLVLFIGVAITGMIVHSKYDARAAQFDLEKLPRFSQRSTVLDVNGELYSHLNGENRFVVSLPRVSKYFIDALLAREDSRFWEHTGVDFKGVVRAAWTNFRTGDVKQGASTITQQLARNSFDLTGRTMDRKALEAVLARRIEKRFSKEEVLEYYVNRIYFGSGFYGVEAAARGYFGKPAAELTLGEGALLAGLIRSPNRFSPIRDLTGSLNERDTVLERMLELKMITAEEAKAAEAGRITVTTQRAMRFAEDQVVDAVTRELEWHISPDVINFGGLRIYTTIDPQLQKLAESAADRQLTQIEQTKGYEHPKKADFAPEENAEGDEEKPTAYLQAALVAIDNRTGAIRAIVGSRDYSQSKYNRALLSKRQIGSTFKPFVYAAAYQRGMLPGTNVDDSKIAAGELRNAGKVRGKEWSPENSDGEYSGLQPASFGLLKSRNTMTVRIGEFVGLPDVRAVATRAGIGERMPDYPVAFLGAFESTVKDITAAYSIFPNHGILRPPYLIARVEDDAGHVIYQAEQKEKRVVNPDAAWMVSDTLQQVMKTGTAAKAASMGWTKPGAGKTGTTNDFFDAWFVGYSSTLTCGVWVGMDKPQTIMSKGYGSALALPVWVDFMQNVPEKSYPAAPFEPPLALAKLRLCSASGGRATSQCEHLRNAYDGTVPSNRVPSGTCRVHPEPPPPAAIYANQQAYPPVATAQTSGSVPAGSFPPASSASYGSRMNAPAVTQIQPNGAQGGGAVAAAPPPAPAHVERTTGGLRIYHATPEPPPAPRPVERAQPPPERELEPRPRARTQVAEAPSSGPSGSVPVMRAIPVQPADRARERDSVAPRPSPPEPRVLRAEPVIRDQEPQPRIFRGRPVEEE